MVCKDQQGCNIVIGVESSLADYRIDFFGGGRNERRKIIFWLTLGTFVCEII